MKFFKKPGRACGPALTTEDDAESVIEIEIRAGGSIFRSVRAPLAGFSGTDGRKIRVNEIPSILRTFIKTFFIYVKATTVNF